MNDMGMTIVACGEYHVVLWLHTSADPAADAWKVAMGRIAELKRKVGDVSKILTLAVSDGGAPNTIQRGEYAELLEGKSKTAGVTTQLSNRLIRGVATALFWLNPNFRAFPPEQFDAALMHLEVIDHREKLLAALRELQKSVAPVQALKVALVAPT